ncbi:MAG: RdgB/HAM1 family non-canonical purine NTP pyrophosphatase [bacterium]
MKEIVLATKNKNKVKEIRKILRGLPIRILFIKDLPDVIEDRKTLKGNAVKKAKEIAKYTNKTALADDSGLEVKALNNKPGIKSARFAGPKCNYMDNNKKLLRLMKNKTNRNATFKCVMALATPKGKTTTVLGIVKGTISTKMQGKNGFGYDPVFIYPPYNKTFAQIPLKTKNKISHRALALEKIRQIIEKMR